MTKTKHLLLFFVTLLFLCSVSGCDKKDLPVGTGVEFYLVKSVSQTDPSAIVTEDRPFIPYSEIQSYNTVTYTYKVSDRVLSSFAEHQKTVEKNTGLALRGSLFVLKVNGEIIYTGMLWYDNLYDGIDSGIYIPAHIENNNMVVNLLHLDNKFPISDKRNDARILSVLREDGKLIE